MVARPCSTAYVMRLDLLQVHELLGWRCVVEMEASAEHVSGSPLLNVNGSSFPRSCGASLIWGGIHWCDFPHCVLCGGLIVALFLAEGVCQGRLEGLQGNLTGVIG